MPNGSHEMWSTYETAGGSELLERAIEAAKNDKNRTVAKIAANNK